jgi:hypothetical protein
VGGSGLCPNQIGDGVIMGHHRVGCIHVILAFKVPAMYVVFLVIRFVVGFHGEIGPNG